MKTVFLYTLGHFMALSAALAVGSWTGTVYEDVNQNGIREEGEPGIPAVAVSNGQDVVRTDAEGRYVLESLADEFVFVIQPNGWRAPLTDDQRPVFYQRVPAAVAPIDFGLTRSEPKTSVQALVLADTQTYSEVDVDYLRRSTVPAIQGTGLAFDFGVTLGDVVNDRLDLLPEINASLAPIGTALYYVNGNHDLDFEVTNPVDAVESFEALYGPSDFAFECGPALFVGLNDIVYPVELNGRKTYIGGLSESQFVWLANLLEVTPMEQPIVFMVHIPFFQPGIEGHDEFRPEDRVRLFQLLKGRSEVMILSGHTHSQRHYFHDTADGWHEDGALHEYNVAAACGSFWSGPLDARGIPSSIMWDGTPPGFGILRISDEGFSTEYLPTNFPADYQIALHAPQAILEGTSWVSFYANVFDGHAGWAVEARAGKEGAWRPMRSVLAADPSYVEAFLAQNRAEGDLIARRLPDPAICFHLWRGYLPADLSAGAVHLTVRATAPDGRVFEQTQTVRVQAKD